MSNILQNILVICNVIVYIVVLERLRYSEGHQFIIMQLFCVNLLKFSFHSKNKHFQSGGHPYPYLLLKTYNYRRFSENQNIFENISLHKSDQIIPCKIKYFYFWMCRKLKKGHKPEMFHIDKGTQFINRQFQNLLNILFFAIQELSPISQGAQGGASLNIQGAYFRVRIKYSGQVIG